MDAVTAALIAEGTEVVFALMGDGNLDLLTKVSMTGRIKLVHACHEQGAVAMADGYARFSGKPGVASVTHGPGLSNTATSLLTAVAARSPVVLIAPDTPTGDLNHPQRFDQQAFIRSTGAMFRPLHRPGTVHADTGAVFRHVRYGKGPAVLNAPTDVLLAPVPPDTEPYKPADEPPAGPAPDPTAVDAAVAALTAARRPVILVGRGVPPGAGAEPVGELADLLGAPITTSLKAKGLLARHPRSLGVAGGLGTRAASRALAAADCVLVLGATANQWTTDGGLTGGVIVHVDHDAEAMGRHSRPDVSVVGDAVKTAAVLRDRLAAAGPRAGWTPPAEESAGASSPAGTSPVHPQQVVDALDAALPEERLLVVDAGHFGSYAQQTLRSWDPRRYAFTHDFGAIGQALGVSIGAAFAREGERVTVVLGDGCLMMSLNELATVRRYGLPLTVVVMNDGGYGQERHSLRAKGFPIAESEHTWPDIASIARGFGIPAHSIGCATDLPLLSQVLAEETGPVLFDVHIDPDAQNRAFADIAARLRGSSPDVEGERR
ncbi:thiamine pyrophosphate-binding protein [Nonomuraea zeae]|uniref:thiamine pyrophosphate-binding protein n=1 Tax=Nonomuraea zeae TaxID=1642303 RepID=UPI0014789D89|nr:thiamine pyrophosphate-binding protein [Nonomuraea zeae]